MLPGLSTTLRPGRRARPGRPRRRWLWSRGGQLRFCEGGRGPSREGGSRRAGRGRSAAQRSAEQPGREHPGPAARSGPRTHLLLGGAQEALPGLGLGGQQQQRGGRQSAQGGRTPGRRRRSPPPGARSRGSRSRRHPARPLARCPAGWLAGGGDAAGRAGEGRGGEATPHRRLRRYAHRAGQAEWEAEAAGPLPLPPRPAPPSGRAPRARRPRCFGGRGGGGGLGLLPSSRRPLEAGARREIEGPCALPDRALVGSLDWGLWNKLGKANKFLSRSA